MYYARELFVKRGPLSTLWLAGSLIRKVTKAQILQADVGKLCDVVSAPPVALALPTQSTLLRGVVRIENKKAIYLLEDAEHTQGRLTAPRKPKDLTTLDPKKILARPEAISFTDEEQAKLADEQYLSMGELDPMAMFVDSTGDFGFFDPDVTESQLSKIDKSAYEGPPEDLLTGSQDIADIRIDDELEFAGMSDDIMFDDFGPEGPPIDFEPDVHLAGVPASPAISELGGIPELDLEIPGGPKRKKPKRKRAYVPVIDETTEIDDATLRLALHDCRDLLLKRPVIRPFFHRADSLEEALQLPAAVDPAEHINVPTQFEEMMRRESRMKPIVDVAGHTPEEMEVEFGGEGAWEFDETGATGDISEGREMEYEMERRGVDRSLVDSMVEAEDAAMAGAEEGGIFAELPLEEGRRRVSKPIQVVSEMETPEFEVPESQFEVPVVEVREREPRMTVERRAVNKHTEIFRTELERQFGRLSRKGAKMVIEFDPFLEQLVQGAPSRRDRALAFYQLLVLTSLEVIQIEQEADMGAINITKGPKFTVRWSSSQMFGSSTPSQ